MKQNSLEMLLDMGWTFFKSFIKWTLIIWFFIFALGAYLAEASETDPAVKMSKSEICHATDSSYYKRTKNFTAYETLEDCLEAGGRLPKNYTVKKES
jgi:hypothetical protein